MKHGRLLFTSFGGALLLLAVFNLVVAGLAYLTGPETASRSFAFQNGAFYVDGEETGMAIFSTTGLGFLILLTLFIFNRRMRARRQGAEAR